MKYNKGFAPILIALIVVGVIAIGGVAYYAGRSSKVVPIVADNNYKSTEEPNNVNGSNSHEVPTGPYYDSSNYVAPEPLRNSNITQTIKVLSPNGGEVYNDSDKIEIKWNGIGKDNTAIYLRSSDGSWCFVKDVPASTSSYVFTPNGHNCTNEDERVLSSGQYKVTLISYEKGGMAPEPGTSFAGNYNDGDSTGKSIDSSDNYFTINSSKVISTANVKLLSFTASKGYFFAETAERLAGVSNIEIKVYYVPTGTGVTEPVLLGSMSPSTGGSGPNQSWSLYAYLQPGTANQTPLLATSIFATLYVDGKQINTINYPYTGASAIYEHVY